LIAFEREEEDMVAIIDQAASIEASVLIPASALAQAWRGGGPRSARLARLIAGTESDALDEARAKEVGERLGNRDKADVADAHVVCCAIDHDAILVTSDPEDIKTLTGPPERLTVVPI
jgi:predicted nucleic acid-binding protein